MEKQRCLQQLPAIAMKIVATSDQRFCKLFDVFMMNDCITAVNILLVGHISISPHHYEFSTNHSNIMNYWQKSNQTDLTLIAANVAACSIHADCVLWEGYMYKGNVYSHNIL